MDYARMKTVVRLALGETTAANSYWSDPEIDAMLNDSQLQVATDTAGMLTFSDITTVSGTQRYSLPTDFLQLKDCQLFNHGTPASTNKKWRLFRVGFDHFEVLSQSNYSRTGRPNYFKMELGSVQVTVQNPGDIWLYPVPDGNGGSDYALRLYYLQKPTVLSSGTDVSELPESLHWAVVYHATAMLSLKSDDMNKYTSMLVLYDRAIARGRAYYAQADRSGAKQIQDVMGYGRSSLGPIR